MRGFRQCRVAAADQLVLRDVFQPGQSPDSEHPVFFLDVIHTGNALEVHDNFRMRRQDLKAHDPQQIRTARDERGFSAPQNR